MMDWNKMEWGVPDFGKPCIIIVKGGKTPHYSVASFEEYNGGVWFTINDVYHVIQVSHWAYITPPNN